MANFCKNSNYGNMHYGKLFENNSHNGVPNYGLKKTYASGPRIAALILLRLSYTTLSN